MKTCLFIGLVALGALASSSAMAQEKPWIEQNVAQPSKALELQLSTGYTQPLGMLNGAIGFPSVATAGIGMELGAGYRIDPHWAVAGAAQYQELTAQNASGVRGLTGDVLASYHVQPDKRLDPWVEIGTGYRFLWETHTGAPTILNHGFELGRLRLGLDIRGDEMASIGPVVGADANLFLWQSGADQVVVSDPRLSTFIFAGIQGRLDVAGTMVGTTTTTSAPMEQ